MKKRVLIIITIMLIIVPVLVMANSMEPPGLVIVLEGKTENVQVWLDVEGKIIKDNARTYPFETQYWFTHSDGFDYKDHVRLNVKKDEQISIFELDNLVEYHNTYTININTMELVKGKTLIRSIRLVGIRLLLTLLIEGFVFYFMGFREKRSWIVFLLINLITQSMLNIYINTLEIATSYAILILIFAEFWVFVSEAIAIPRLLNEGKYGKKISFVLIANILSLVVGGYLITLLPL
jgi:hypothetical protein